VSGWSHPVQRVARSSGSRARAFGCEWVFGPSGPNGYRLQGVKSEAPEGITSRGQSAVEKGQPRSTRTDSQEEKNSEVGEADGIGDPAVRGPGRPGSGQSGNEKGTHSRWGNQATASTAWESGKPAVTRRRIARLCTSVDNGKGVSCLERGVALTVRGKPCRRNPRNGCGTKQGREPRTKPNPLRG